MLWLSSARVAVLFAFLVCAAPLVCAVRDYYEVLGVKSRASEREIKSAYRKRARQIHPDKHPEKADEFVELSEAYQVLSDPEMRNVYDRHGADAVQQHQTFKSNEHANDPLDLFRQFFGGAPAEQQTPKGPTKLYRASISLEDIYIGRSFPVEHERVVVCPACFGSGAHSSKHIHTCSQCQGEGAQLIRQQIMPGFVTNMQITCNRCGGAGRLIEKLCGRCQGARTVRDSVEIDVEVEAGAREGAKYVFEGMADEDPEHDAGDVIVEVYSTTKPGDFRRAGHNLYMTRTLSLRDALFGFNHQMKHYDNHTFQVRRSGVTQPGHVVRIEGEGLPIPPEDRDAAGGKTKGDLFVEFLVILPRVDAKALSALEHILDETPPHSEL